MVGVIGPDGVGKSTLFSLVAGARAIQSRRIEVLSGDIADARHRRRVCPRIAYMPQGLGKNLYLDEPTTGVDPLSRRQFWELLDRMRAARPSMSVLVATAYMEEASRFDWLVAMNAGRVLDTGTPREFLARTGSRTLEEAFIALLPPT